LRSRFWLGDGDRRGGDLEMSRVANLATEFGELGIETDFGAFFGGDRESLRRGGDLKLLGGDRESLRRLGGDLESLRRGGDLES
jgi:hypothetical protein